MLDRKVAVYGDGADTVAHYMYTWFGFSAWNVSVAYLRAIEDYLGFSPNFPLCLLQRYYPDLANMVPYTGCDLDTIVYGYKMLKSAMEQQSEIIDDLRAHVACINPYTRTLAYGRLVSAEKQYFLDSGFEVVSAGPVQVSDKHVFTDKNSSVIMAQLLCLDVFKPDAE